MKDEILEALLKRKKEKKFIVERIMTCDLNDIESLTFFFDEYIVNRFLIFPEDTKRERNLIQLAKISIARAENIPSEDIRFKDAKDCTGSNSSMTKKVLLIISIEKDFKIEFDGEEAADIDTIHDLVNLYAQTKRGMNARYH